MTDTRSKLQKMMDEADKKASTMTEEEINANLGPATRAFFNLAEGLEKQIGPSFVGLGGKIVMIITAMVLSWLTAKIFLLLPATIFLMGPLSALFVLLGVRTAFGGTRNNSIGKLQAFWFTFMVWGLYCLNLSSDIVSQMFTIPLSGFIILTMLKINFSGFEIYTKWFVQAIWAFSLFIALQLLPENGYVVMPFVAAGISFFIGSLLADFTKFPETSTVYKNSAPSEKTESEETTQED